MSSAPPIPFSGNVAGISKDTRGWFLGHFMAGDDSPLRTSDLELKWYTHAKGETRSDWAPGNPVKTLNILIRGHFVLLFPDREIALKEEGDFVLFGPGVPHSFRSEEESLVLTVRWPSQPAEKPTGFPAGKFTRQHADQLVATYLDEHEVAAFDFESPLPRHEDRHTQKLMVSRVDEHDFGWVFFYDSSSHIATGKASDALVGNAPLIVDRVDGKLYIAGTAHPIEHYLEEYRRGKRTKA